MESSNSSTGDNNIVLVEATVPVLELHTGIKQNHGGVQIIREVAPPKLPRNELATTASVTRSTDHHTGKVSFSRHSLQWSSDVTHSGGGKKCQD